MRFEVILNVASGGVVQTVWAFARAHSLTFVARDIAWTAGGESAHNAQQKYHGGTECIIRHCVANGKQYKKQETLKSC